ncbi:phage tail protein [Ectopseudomonas oleovorans]|uniref:phage tail protein n=1 Tax=Ectopseudomonas oleovorans TaxID=301 RepID=UPI0024414954|nr:phage tail protein [Pseudomonas oleovorans]WGG19275.1 phage tail protein [Pseudomonas oleovorans]
MTDQNSQFYAILTAIGEAKQANAAALGVAWRITHMGVGDANGTEPQPQRTQTKLINERRRAALNQLSVDPTNSSIIIAEQIIPEDVGGWWIREIGLYDEAGDLVAVGNCAPSYKPLLTQGTGRNQIIRMSLIVSSSEHVELKIDPSIVLASRRFVEQAIEAHARVAASETVSGHVVMAKVAEVLAGTGGAKAASPAGVKAADDKIRSDLTAKSPSIFIVDQLRQAVESASGGRQTVLYTAKGQPSYMHILPRFNLEDVAPGLELGSGTHPAFLVNGAAKSELFIGAYHAQLIDGEAVSRPGVDPRTSITFDNARAACRANGAGWHLFSNWEWAAIALWCMANGYEPRGNTNFGRHHEKRWETGRRQDGGIPGEVDAAKVGRTLTGSGPAIWAHDGTPAGIHDLVGNIWEWVDGMKLVDGRVHMPLDNNFNQLDADWPAHALWFSGSTPSNNGTTALVTDAASVVRNGAPGDDGNGGLADLRNPWSGTPIAGEAPLLAKQALIAPAGISPQGYVHSRSYGTRFPLRGGDWNIADIAGLAALYLIYSRAAADSTVGFRPAFAL